MTQPAHSTQIRDLEKKPWLFWVAPIVGGMIGGVISKWLQED